MTLYVPFAGTQFQRGGVGAFCKGAVGALLAQVLTTALITAAVTAAVRLR